MKRDALQLVRSIYRANKSTAKTVHLETFLGNKGTLPFNGKRK
jgi:hypothetical protein